MFSQLVNRKLSTFLINDSSFQAKKLNILLFQLVKERICCFSLSHTVNCGFWTVDRTKQVN